MSIKTKEEILDALKEIFKDDTSDTALTILEDVSDTFTDLTDKSKGDGVDWEQKYKDNDREWREKYRDRFFNHSADDPIEDIDNDDQHEEIKTKFEELFSEKGE